MAYYLKHSLYWYHNIQKVISLEIKLKNSPRPTNWRYNAPQNDYDYFQPETSIADWRCISEMKDNYIELSMKYISVIFDKNVSVKTVKIYNAP